jgi:hypothetical protein
MNENVTNMQIKVSKYVSTHTHARTHARARTHTHTHTHKFINQLIENKIYK